MEAESSAGFEFSAQTTMDSAEAEFLAAQIKDARNFLEFGAGYSTKLALKNPNCQIISIETSEKYIENLKREIAQEGLDSSRVKFLHIDIGPTRDWGRPVDESKIELWPNYTEAPWQFIKSQNFKPDLILIDGRFRAATLLQAWRYAPGCTVIFDDYNNRIYYHKVQALIIPKKKIGRIAVFEIPKWTRFRMKTQRQLLQIFRLDFE
jgi:hypothetical protein